MIKTPRNTHVEHYPKEHISLIVKHFYQLAKLRTYICARICQPTTALEMV